MPLLIPVYPAFLSGLPAKDRRFALIMFAEPLILISVGLLMTNLLMPLADNVLFDAGLGPILLGGPDPVSWTKAPRQFWGVVTAIGVAGASALISLLLLCCGKVFVASSERGDVGIDEPEQRDSIDAEKRNAKFMILTFLFYMMIIGFRGFFDRYLIFPMFLLTPLCVWAFSWRINSVALMRLLPLSLVFILIYAALSVAATHDYFSWNRARWQAGEELVLRGGISPLRIDGGLEFNGWYGYEPQYRNSGGIVFSSDMRHGNDYLLTMKELPGYATLARYKFESWLPLRTGEILFLRCCVDRPVTTNAAANNGSNH